MADLILSEKYKAFLRCTAPVEFLEGTTAAGKTTVGLFKFILRCAESEKRIHVLSGLDRDHRKEHYHKGTWHPG